jgi:hypothetical protein
MQQHLAKCKNIYLFVAFAQTMGKECNKKDCWCIWMNTNSICSWENNVFSRLFPWCRPCYMGQRTNWDKGNAYPNVPHFMKYLKKHWLPKVNIWCVGNWNIPYIRQHTNSTMESFHSNMKHILYSSREKFIGHRMDWIIYHLVGDVLTHYWYDVQYKVFGCIKNKK